MSAPWSGFTPEASPGLDAEGCRTMDVGTWDDRVSVTRASEEHPDGEGDELLRVMVVEDVVKA
jgi:hypothetical protein